MLEFNATLSVCIISFVIFLLMINAILYEPLSQVVQHRMRYINSNYKDAEAAKENLKKIVDWREERLQKSKEVAREVYSKLIKEFKLKKDIYRYSCFCSCKHNTVVPFVDFSLFW